MIFPVRCFTCNKTLSQYYNTYKELTESNVPIKDVFEILKIKRYCCRRMFLGHVNILDKLMMYDSYEKKETN
jgi:DNA-directed RNA polymerases I, II, and III subunit RPABC5